MKITRYLWRQPIIKILYHTRPDRPCHPPHHVIRPISLAAAADDELAGDAWECFVSSIVDNHVSTSAGIGVAGMETERQLRLELQGAVWDMARRLRIVFSSF